MNDVKKWNLPRGTTVSESPEGEFVLASDYAALEAELAKLRAVPDGWSVERVCYPSGYVLHSPGGSMIRVCDSGMGGIETAFAMFLKAMLAAAPSAPATVQGDGWIPVSERLPNVAQEVIIFSGFEGVCAGVLDSYGEWFAPCSEYKLTRVTHWMPLPAAPKVV